MVVNGDKAVISSRFTQQFFYIWFIKRYTKTLVKLFYFRVVFNLVSIDTIFTVSLVVVSLNSLDR